MHNRKFHMIPGSSGKFIRYMSAILIMIFAAACSLVMMWWFSRYIGDQIYNERSSHIQQLTEKMAQTVDSAISVSLGYADTVGEMLEDISPEDPEQFIAVLEHLNNHIPFEDSMLIAMSDSGEYFTSSGKTGLYSSVDEYSRNRVSAFSELDENGIIFIHRAEKHISLGDNGSLDYVVLYRDMRTMQYECRLTGGIDEYFTAIVNSDGNKVYIQDNYTGETENWNVNEMLRNHKIRTDVVSMSDMADVTDGSIDFSEALTAGDSVSVAFRYEDYNFFAACCPLSYSGWSAVMFVPESQLSVQTNILVTRMIIFCCVIAALLIVTAALAVWLLVVTTNHRRAIRANEQLIKKLSEQTESAIRSNEQKSIYYSNVTHDIRTPIAGILGMVDIAEKELDAPEKLADCINKIRISAGHLLALVNDVLDLRCLEKGEVILEAEQIDIFDIVNKCNAMMNGYIKGRKIEYVCDSSGLKYTKAKGYPLQLQQVLVNLLGNAVKFTPDGGEVVFTISDHMLESGKCMYRFSVSDNGIGISEEFKKKLFVPFAREHSTVQNGVYGTGLGLPIAKQLVELMGGSIDVISSQGTGTEFIVSLEMTPVGSEKTQRQTDVSGMKILVADDDAITAEIVRFNLEQLGAEIISVGNGSQAVEIFSESASGDIDLILMDMKMPVMSGIQAAGLIRSMDREDSGQVRILALTANIDDDIRKNALDAGMNGLLLKPVDIEELKNILAGAKE